MRAWILGHARRDKEPGRAASLYLVNAHTLNLAYADRDYREVLNRGTMVLNDGVGLEMYGKLARKPFAYNFNGTDLFPRLFREADGPLSLYLYGGLPGRAERAAAALQARYPMVRVVGLQDGYSPRSIVPSVNAARPDLLLVGMGNPHQERWIHEHRDQLQVGVAAGVGALLDFLSGATPRAPAPLRRARLEWAYRLALEPRRLFGRYVLGNPAFVVRSVAYLALQRTRDQRPTNR